MSAGIIRAASIALPFLLLILGCARKDPTPPPPGSQDASTYDPSFDSSCRSQFGKKERTLTPVPQSIKKVMLIFLENLDAETVKSHPTFARIAKQGAYLNNYFAITHPSQPNYFALITGQFFPVGNKIVTLDVPHLGRLLAKAGKTWKSYSEDYPGNCYTGKSYGKYFRAHQPFISMKDIQESSSLCSNIVPMSEFSRDLSRQSIPDFSFIVPNNDNNGHDLGVDRAGQWIQETLSPVLSNAELIRETLVVITFDEDAGTRPTHPNKNKIYTALLGAGIKSGSVSDQCFDHFSLLATLEMIFGTGDLGQRDNEASSISEIWDFTK